VHGVPYRVTTRATGKVQRSDHDALPDAVEAAITAARLAAAEPHAKTIDLRARRWAPEDQVATRIELKGPERWRPATQAGIDVLGDGSLQAWTGAPERRAIEPAEGEDAYAALRRALTG
jgi:hypothetical protein